MDLTTHSTQLLWIGSLTAAPLAILVCIASRWPGCRPATRHAMWLAVIASFITPLFTSLIGRPAWFQSARILEACRGLFEHPQPAPAPQATASATSAGLEVASAKPGISRPAAAPSTTSATPLFAPALTQVPDLAAFIASNTPSSRPTSSSATTITPPAASSPAASEQNAPLPTVTLPVDQLVGQQLDRNSVQPDEHAAARDAVNCTPSPASPMATTVAVDDCAVTELDASKAMIAAAPATAAPMTDAAMAGNASSTPRQPQLLQQAPPPAASKAPTVRQTMQAWLTSGLAIRDQLSSVPPLPAVLWFVGAGLMLLVFAIRMLAMRRILARARPARESMLTLVDSCARHAGLASAPLTLETHDRLSPMIVCGLRPTLVLPIALWKELDEDSRRAVVLHELAHLRRRDHRTAWFVAFVGLVYWWHPIVWWARRRINEEADTCCDAWVTSLLPEGRRAYARALLATKSFLSLPNQNLAVRCAPPGLGVMSGGAKRLARRITMVMTQRTAPRPSVLGAAAAMMIAAVGTFVMPGIACPPSEQPEAGAQAAAPRAKTRTIKPATATGPAQSEFFGEAPGLEAMRRNQSAARTDAVNAEAQSLEKAILELERRLEKMEADLGGQQTPRPRAGRNTFPALAPMAPMAPSSPFGPARVLTPIPPVAGMRGTQAMPALPAQGFGTSAGKLTVTSPAEIAVVDSGQIFPRTYTLPKGKLEALTELMRRDDVPIFIEPGDDKMVVNATESQHRTFAAFLAMIHPESSPIAISPAEGNALTPAAAEELARRKYEGAFGRYRVDAANHAGEVARLQDQLKQLQSRQKNAERQAENLRRRSERAQEQAEKMQEQAEEFESRMNDATDDAARTKLKAQFDALQARMQSAEAQSAALEASADQAEASAEQMEAMIDEMESQIDAITDAMSEAADAEAAAAGAPSPAQAPEAPEAPEIPDAPAAPEAPEAPAAPQPAAAPAASPSTAI